jgi:predicted AAA+ superfamily ATPase
MNVCILWEIFKILKGRNTKLILYTFDSFTFDVDKTEKKVIEEILEHFKNKKLQVKYSYGDTCNFE